MAMKSLPSQRLLERLFSYDPATGSLIWRERPAWMFRETRGRRRAAAHAAWNTKFAGAEAGALFSAGYLFVSVFKRKYSAHRLIWKLVYGYDPVCIDHINRDRCDNRLVNLRNVGMSENAINQSVRTDNTSGVPGVFWHSGLQRWVARIKLRRKEYALGRFGTKEEAVAARREAEVRLSFHPASL